MEEIFEAFGEPRSSSRNKKASIRNKYKRKLKHLAHTLDALINLANQRLDEAQSGRIYRREKTQDLLDKCKALRELLPSEDGKEPDEIERIYKSLDEFFGISRADQDDSSL
jgi:hypothetical protein